jgi:hypothetical protein
MVLAPNREQHANRTQTLRPATKQHPDRDTIAGPGVAAMREYESSEATRVLVIPQSTGRAGQRDARIHAQAIVRLAPDAPSARLSISARGASTVSAAC